MSDAALVETIRQTLEGSPFHGEGYRKVWARLRHAGLRTSKERVRRLMRENGLSAGRTGRPRGPRNHDGTIIPETVDHYVGHRHHRGIHLDHGQVAVFVAVDHCSAECVGIHAALHGTRHEALEPVRQGVAVRLGSVGKNAARGLAIRHDHGSQYMSRDFQREIAWLGASSSPAFIRALPWLHPLRSGSLR
jgi:putative transposase